MSKWTASSEGLPEANVDVEITGPQFLGTRRAKRFPSEYFWRFCDCTHPQEQSIAGFDGTAWRSVETNGIARKKEEKGVKDRLWCPSDIEVLIHCHCFPMIHPRADAPAVKDGIKKLHGQGLIERNEDDFSMWHTTQKGCAMIESLCRTPPPSMMVCWSDANGNVLLAKEG